MDFSEWWLRHLLWNCPNMNVTGLELWKVNIGSGNSFRVPTDERRKISMIFQWYFKTKIPNFPDNSECYKKGKTQDQMLHMGSSYILWPLLGVIKKISMSNWSKIQWFFHDFFIFTIFKNFSSNSMIFPWSWNRSEFQWFFESCGNPELGAVRQQAITWANIDLDPCRHMTSLGHNELTLILDRFAVLLQSAEPTCSTSSSFRWLMRSSFSGFFLA